MKFGVVVFPGSNCDNDCFHVVKNVLEQEAVFLWHQDRDLQHCDGVIIPGGFSYGDYLRTGAIARFSPVMESIRHFAEEGGLVMGICNGFQILVESHLLPGALLPNSVAHFVCRKVALRVENIHTPFTTLFYPGEVIHIPIAHHQGNYYTSPETLSELEAQKRIPFRYCTEKGDTDERSNPNGSLNNIAGIISEKGNVLGMMPHPERASESLLNSEDGKKIFLSIIKWQEETNHERC